MGGSLLVVSDYVTGKASNRAFRSRRSSCSGDAAATAHNIMTHQLLYRLGFAFFIEYISDGSYKAFSSSLNE
jgi:hypothetical protein